ncbi:MAG: hypothetical protein LUG24_09025, partial [Clostridiales bacterium]|nr:hypothetical protein [Clostridiales bacterium]
VYHHLHRLKILINHRFLSKKTANFIEELYTDEYNKYITLYEIYDFAEEFNTSLDFLLGRSDKEYL